MAQSPLAFNERTVSQVFPVNSQQLEGIEERPVSPEQQVLEVAPPAPIEAHDLPVDHRVMSLDRVCEFFTQLRPVLEGVAIA